MDQPAPGSLDVMMAGMVFCDIVFTGMPAAPAPGTEVWTQGMGTSPGGISTLAVATARLGLRTGLAAGFGDDAYGSWCWHVLADQEGVDLSRSRVFDHWHQPVTVSMAYQDDRAMVTHGHDAPLTATELIGDPPATRAVITELDGEADPWWRAAQRQGALVFADVGWDPTGTWDRALLRELDGCYCFMPNEVEAMAYTRTSSAHQAARALAEYVPLAVVTRGPRGAVAVNSETGESVEVPALDVPAIDPTGAGDVFGAALVTSSLSNWPVEHRLRFAALCASLSVQQFAGALAAPGWGDVVDWWQHQQVQAAAGKNNAIELVRSYGFLADQLRHRQCHAVRRAEATIARSSDLATAIS